MPEKKETKAAVFPRRCAECGKTEVYRETIDYKTKFKYEGHLHEFEAHGISVNRCRACGEFSLPNTAQDQIAEAFRSHAKLLTAEQIRENLQGLQLSQKDFAELIGVAPETVSRWLTHVQIQTRSMDRLMQLFFASAEVRSLLERMKEGGSARAALSGDDIASARASHRSSAASHSERRMQNSIQPVCSQRFSRRYPANLAVRRARFQLIASFN